MLIDELKIVKAIRKFEPGYSLPFTTPITLLVGDNGCGKSTLLDILRDHYGVEDVSWFKQMDIASHAEICGDDLSKDRVFYFDFHSGDQKYSPAFRGDMGSQLIAQRLSSGQGLAYQFRGTGIMSAVDSLVLLDEPERGFSLKLQYVIGEMLFKLASQGNQLIVATHSLPIMKQSAGPSVSLYSVEHHEYMELDDFLQRHLVIPGK